MTTPAGWYPDPYDPAQLRYWDGSVWTDSVTPSGDGGGSGTGQPQANPYEPQGALGAQPAFGVQDTPVQGIPPGGGYAQPWDVPQDGASGGGFGDVGDWLSSAFSRLFERIGPMAVLLYAVPAVGFVIAAILGRSVLSGITITGAGTGTGRIDGFGGGALALMLLFVFATIIASAIAWLGANHQMYSAHVGQPASVGASLLTGLRRLPRLIGWGLLAAIAAAIIYAVLLFIFLALVFAAIGTGGEDGNPALILLILPIGLVVFVFLAWLWVKFAFWGVAVAVGPSGTNPFSASWSLSRGRFWGTLGRLLLMVVLVWLVSIAFNIVFQVVFGTALSTLFQVDADSGDLLINGQNIEDQDVIRFGDFIPGVFWFAAIAAAYTLSQAISQAISISATAGLYVRGGGRGEV